MRGSCGTAELFYSHLSENVPENIYDPTLNDEVNAYTASASSGPGLHCRATLPGRTHLQRPGR